MNGFRKTFTITRHDAGSYVEGVWVEGSESDIDIQASAQPLRPDEVQLLPEARRNEQAFKIYTDAPLQIAEPGDSTNSDKITIDGEVFELISVAPNQSDVINHYKAIAVKPIP